VLAQQFGGYSQGDLPRRAEQAFLGESNCGRLTAMQRFEVFERGLPKTAPVWNRVCEPLHDAHLHTAEDLLRLRVSQVPIRRELP
jgi:hypothetical protein